MIITIAIWNDLVSSPFDFSNRILLVETDGDKELSRSQIYLESRSSSQRVNQLKNLEVDVLICGAISRALAEMIMSSGIEVIAYITGNVNEVLEAYKGGQLDQSQFIMPGCWLGARKGHRRSGQTRQRCRRRGNQGNIDL
ncbi:MAG: NifB/NifX family molybdenum-iron cluster-binding protein [Nitrosomonadaceae bacterium]